MDNTIKTLESPVSEEYLRYRETHQNVNTLAVARALQDIDDEEACSLLGWTMEKLEKFENSCDDDVAFSDLVTYARMVGKKVVIEISDPCRP